MKVVKSASKSLSWLRASFKGVGLAVTKPLHATVLKVQLPRKCSNGKNDVHFVISGSGWLNILAVWDCQSE